MTSQQLADDLLHEWQTCPAPPAERMDEIDYRKLETLVHLSMNFESDSARGVFD